MITAHTKSSLIAFEDRIKAHWESGQLPCLLHLCGGNEDSLLRLFEHIRPGDWVFSTHRNHYHALLGGVPEAELEKRILDGRSMFIFWNPENHKSELVKSCNFYTSAILAGTACIATGVAHAIAEDHREALGDYWREPVHASGKTQFTHATRPFPWVWCFIGDGAIENGHFAEAIQWASWNRLPITYVLEDNDRQVDTPKQDRRGYFADDWEHAVVWPIAHFRSYNYNPTYPHAGSGCKHQIAFQPEAVARLKQSVAG